MATLTEFLRSTHIQSVVLAIVASVYSLVLSAAVVVIDDDVFIDYTKFIADRNPISVDTYAGANSRRDVIELLLFMQILDAGGFSHKIKLHSENSYRRMLAMVASGEALAYGTPAWSGDLVGYENKYWYSEEMVRANEFVVGAYTSEKNARALSTEAQHLNQLTAVTSRQWRVDWNVLKDLKVKSQYSASNFPNMLKMVGARRADFTLSPFYPNSDMKIRQGSITLIPIPNIRISMGEGRRWAVSLNHPMSVDIQKAIAKGMGIFRQRGTITRAYTESGFFDPRVSAWPIVNAEKSVQVPVEEAAIEY